MVGTLIRSKIRSLEKAFAKSSSVYPGPIIRGECPPKSIIRMRYHKIKIGTQVTIKYFLFNLSKYFKKRVTKISQHKSMKGLHHKEYKETTVLKTKK